jgi:hypothetical protein
MDDALAHIEGAFGGTTLAEVLSEPTHSPPLCEVGVDRTRRAPVG